MEVDRAEAVRDLLLEAERAHAAYETVDLAGVRDQDWARWYGAFALEHGLEDILGHRVPLDQVGPSLSKAYAEFEERDPKPSEGWADFVGRRVVEAL
jgi:hypothetical protein